MTATTKLPSHVAAQASKSSLNLTREVFYGIGIGIFGVINILNVPFFFASLVALSAALYQLYGPEDKDGPIAITSRQLNAVERNYTTTERKCLAMVFGVKKFCHYLLTFSQTPWYFLLIIWPCDT